MRYLVGLDGTTSPYGPEVDTIPGATRSSRTRARRRVRNASNRWMTRPRKPACAEDDPRPGAQQLAGGRATDAGAAAGDDGNGIGERLHALSSICDGPDDDIIVDELPSRAGGELERRTRSEERRVGKEC